MKLTQKQQLFILAFIELGNASAAYRRAYSASKMKAPTVNRRATEMLANGMITARIAELRVEAAKKAVLDRAWVLDRLMRNVRIAMGEERIKVAIRPKSAPDTVVELEITRSRRGCGQQSVRAAGQGGRGRFVQGAASQRPGPTLRSAPQSGAGLPRSHYPALPKRAKGNRGRDAAGGARRSHG